MTSLIATCWTIAGGVRPDRPDPISRWRLEDRIEAAARGTHPIAAALWWSSSRAS